MAGRVLPIEEIEMIFNRFPEGNPYYIPLLVGYWCGFTADQAFALTFECVQPETVLSGYSVKYNRSDNQLYFYRGVDRKTAVPMGVEKALRRAINRNLCITATHRRPNYYIDKKGRLNTISGRRVLLINLRPDGTFVSPLGLNHIARVIHGKKGDYEHPDPEWKFEDMIASGRYYNGVFANLLSPNMKQ